MATTTPIQSVTDEEDQLIVREITSVGMTTQHSSQQQQPQEPESTWAAYPEKYVEYVEVAGKFLRAVFDEKQLVDDLQGHADLQQRFDLALSECLVMLKEIGKKVTEARQASECTRP